MGLIYAKIGGRGGGPGLNITYLRISKSHILRQIILVTNMIEAVFLYVLMFVAILLTVYL